MVHIQPKLHNCVKRGFLGKNDKYYLFQSITSHHAKMFKKNDNMWRRWGTPQNSFLAFIGELKKQIISSISQWYDLKFLRYRANILKLIILGHFLPSPPPPTPRPLFPSSLLLKNFKINILKNEKIFRRYHHFTHVHQN